MRLFAILILAASSCSMLYADEPGVIVIKPQGSEPKYVERNGYILIQPQHQASPKGEVIKLTGKPKQEPAAPKEVVPQPQDALLPKDVQLETWDVLYINGQHVGYVHTVVREYERNGQKLLYGTKTQNMTIARFGQRVSQWAEDATLETTDGQILATRMAQGLGSEQKLILTGQVQENKLIVTIAGLNGDPTAKPTDDAKKPDVQTIPWPAGVLGVAGEANMLQDRKPKPGETFDYLHYEGRLNRVVKFTAKVGEVVQGKLFTGQPERMMLPVTISMEPIKTGPDSEFQLPDSTVWADPVTFESLKMESASPAFGGTVGVVRGTREIAMAPPRDVPDLFKVQSIELNRAVPNIHAQKEITYRVHLTSDDASNKLFREDARQRHIAVEGMDKTYYIHVVPVRSPQPTDAPAKANEEFLGTSYFLDWENDGVKNQASQAIRDLPPRASQWEKAQAVEKWVHNNMRSTEFSQAMTSCATVSKELRGDCTEYAMLSAGLCRALGIPSRTAMGVVYAAPGGGKPFLAYHMWYEVLVDGQWIALDATLGNGSVGPGHLKIADNSWHEERSLAPLLPVMGVLNAQPKIDIVEVVSKP